MRIWIALVLIAAAGTTAYLLTRPSNPHRSIEAGQRFEKCVAKDAHTEPVERRCWREVRSDLPRCPPSAPTPVGLMRGTPLLITTDNGDGGRCIVVLGHSRHAKAQRKLRSERASLRRHWLAIAEK